MEQVEEADIIWAIIYTSLVFVLMAIALILFYYFSKKQILTKEIEQKNREINHHKELVKSVIMAQEEVSSRIAQNLHDDISSKLNIISLNSHLLSMPGLSGKEMAQLTKTIIELAAKTLENSRRIAHDLLPPVLEKFGLEAAIEELCTEYSGIVKINLTGNNDKSLLKSLSPDVSLHIFRILQELITNSIRHGKAKTIAIQFLKKNNIRKCIYTDDGIGFDILSIEKKRA